MTDRERFEAWWTDRLVKQGWDADNAKLVFYRSTIGGLTYSSAPTENAWQGWQAATAAADADLTQSVQMYVDAARERDEAIAAEIKAEADKWAAVRRCAEIAADMVEDSEFPGYNTACGEINDAIKAEFPEAFK